MKERVHYTLSFSAAEGQDAARAQRLVTEFRSLLRANEIRDAELHVEVRVVESHSEVAPHRQ